MKIIEVIVTPKGESTVQTKGFAGADCIAASRFVEDALGHRLQERKTAEFFSAQETESQQVHQ